MPASAAELNAKKEGLKAAGVVSGRGTAAVEPFIETIAVALKELGSTCDLQCGTGTLTLSAACGPAPVVPEDDRSQLPVDGIRLFDELKDPQPLEPSEPVLPPPSVRSAPTTASIQPTATASRVHVGQVNRPKYSIAQ